MKLKARVAQEDETPILVFDPVCGGVDGRHLSTRIDRDHGPCDLWSRRSARPHFAGACGQGVHACDRGCGLAAGRRRRSVHLPARRFLRSEEHTSELQSLMRISYAVFCLKKKNNTTVNTQIQSEKVKTR